MVSQINVVSYNIGFCGGDSGLSDGVQDANRVVQRLSDITQYLKSCEADVVALQEVDCRSRRSAYIDQKVSLTQLTEFPYFDWVDTWQHPWVPYPLTWNVSRHFGPVHAGQLLLSRHPFSDRRQVSLCQRQDRPLVYNWFYLHAKYHEVCIELPTGRYWVGQCHLDAFDSKTRALQTQQIMDHWDQNGVPDIVLGDWNCAPTESMVTVCLDSGLHVVVDHSLLDYPRIHPTEQLSYVAHRSQWISHAFVDATVSASDHLPLVCQIKTSLL